MQKQELISESKKSFDRLMEYCQPIPENIFFFQPPNKWSIAQNVDHLIRSMKKTNLAFSLPKFILKLYVGRSNRPSRTFDELVNKYKQKLELGGVASGPFIPSGNSEAKTKLLDHWNRVTKKYLQLIDRRWNDEQLDQYIAPHPLLGKITMRELCYFTIYHTGHHLKIIQSRNSLTVEEKI